MTQEDKELLLQDICTRLPYRLKGTVEIEVSTGDYSIESGHLLFMDKEIDVELLGINKEIGEIEVYPLNDNIDLNDYDYIIDDFTPYLRPMSSMTEEEKKELQKITNNTFYFGFKRIKNSNTPLDGEWHTVYNNPVTNVVCNKLISWLDKNHFDHRTDEEGKTLIEKGLALEAPEGMYKNY